MFQPLVPYPVPGGNNFGPIFDGRYARNLTTDPTVNYLSDVVNQTQESMYRMAQLGGPMAYGAPRCGPMGFPPPSFCPPGMPYPAPRGSHGIAGHHASSHPKKNDGIGGWAKDIAGYAAAGFLLSGCNPLGGAVGAGVGILKRLIFN